MPPMKERSLYAYPSGEGNHNLYIIVSVDQDREEEGGLGLDIKSCPHSSEGGRRWTHYNEGFDYVYEDDLMIIEYPLRECSVNDG